jgi:molybdopterin synthase sulfur carrier subunit
MPERRAGANGRPLIATDTTMKSVYFAWVRERIGKTDEDIAPPASVVTIGDLIAWLSRHGEGYAYAFENPGVICAAIDRTRVGHDATIAGAGEIAFFPPMTGG